MESPSKRVGHVGEKITRIVKATVSKWTDQRNRKDQIILTRLRLGHTWLTKQHLFEKKPPESCSVCDRRLTVHHLLIGCQRYAAQRREVNLSDSLEDILKNNRESELKVLQYVRKIEIYNKI